ncbi:TRAFAC clade GTPase domain-containing protein [Streptomyces phaeochromogenes]
MPTIVCPYCFTSDRDSRLAYRCLMARTGVRGVTPCAPETDGTWAAFTGVPAGGAAAQRGPCFDAPRGPRGGRGRAPCPACRVGSPVRVCRHCHNDLPSDYCDQSSRIIALIGPKSAGKSTYVTVLAHELRNRVGREFSAAVASMGSSTQQRYRAMEDDLYHRLLLPGPTQPAAMRFNDPLIFRLSTPRPAMGGLRDGSRHTALVFFDAAGEDLASAEAMDRYTAYLAAADGVILLVDPLQLRTVREQLADIDWRLPPVETAPEQIAADLAAQLRGRRRGEGQGKVTTPLAVAITKSDVLRPWLPNGSLLGRPAVRAGAVDDADRLAVHQDTRALLDEWDGGLLHRQLDRDFADFSLFCLSALGSPPPADAPSDAPKSGPRPLRVEDPLLWLLGRRGLLPVRTARTPRKGREPR